MEFSGVKYVLCIQLKELSYTGNYVCAVNAESKKLLLFFSSQYLLVINNNSEQFQMLMFLKHHISFQFY